MLTCAEPSSVPVQPSELRENLGRESIGKTGIRAVVTLAGQASILDRPSVFLAEKTGPNFPYPSETMAIKFLYFVPRGLDCGNENNPSQ